MPDAGGIEFADHGDGFADVVVGAPFQDGTSTDEGAAFVYLGSAAGPATTPSLR